MKRKESKSGCKRGHLLKQYCNCRFNVKMKCDDKLSLFGLKLHLYPLSAKQSYNDY